MNACPWGLFFCVQRSGRRHGRRRVWGYLPIMGIDSTLACQHSAGERRQQGRVTLPLPPYRMLWHERLSPPWGERTKRAPPPHRRAVQSAGRGAPIMLTGDEHEGAHHPTVDAPPDQMFTEPAGRHHHWGRVLRADNGVGARSRARKQRKNDRMDTIPPGRFSVHYSLEKRNQFQFLDQKFTIATYWWVSIVEL